MKNIEILSRWSTFLFLLKRTFTSQRGALSFTIKNVITHGLGGMKIRLVKITYDGAYVNGTGYVITPANCNLKTQIVSMSSVVIGAFMVSPAISGANAVLKVYKGAAGVNVEASTNEATLDTLVGLHTVWGY